MVDFNEGELLDIIQRESLVDPSLLSPETKLEELGISSIDVVSIVFAIEERYNIELSGEEFATAGTFGELLEDLTTKVRNSGR